MTGCNARPRFGALLWVLMALVLVAPWRVAALPGPVTLTLDNAADFAEADQAQPAALPREFPRDVRVEVGASRAKLVPVGPGGSGTAIVPGFLSALPPGADERVTQPPALPIAARRISFQARAPPLPVA